MQDGEVVGLRRDVERRGACARQQGLVVAVAVRGFTDGDECFHRPEARGIRRVAGIARPGKQDTRRAVFGHVRCLGRREARVERRLDEPGLVQGALDLDQLGAVARLNRHAIALGQA